MEYESESDKEVEDEGDSSSDDVDVESTHDAPFSEIPSKDNTEFV